MGKFRKTWYVRAGGSTPVSSGEALASLLLAQRGIPESDQHSFFEPRYERDIHDPYSLYGMKKAVDLIADAVVAGKRILVHGDYDADGIAATAIMVQALQALGAHVVPFLPHRTDDGYGLHLPVLRKLTREFDVLITVDCGIANAQEVQWLKKKGKTVIITDHHELPAPLPPAHAIIHPRHPKGSYSFPWLCGAAVSWKLACALLVEARFAHLWGEDGARSLLDLVALGTIADMMPLAGENRALVVLGMRVLRRTKRPGLRALASATGVSLHSCTGEDIAYRIIPLLNAAGRMDHAQPALDALLTEDDSLVGNAVAQLVKYNTARRSLTRQVMEEAEQQAQKDAPVIFAFNVQWPAGVVGLAAGRLVEKFARPAVVVGGNGTHAVGSARGPAGTDVLELLSSGREYLLNIGGHKRAAGFSVALDAVTTLQSAIMKAARKKGGTGTSSHNRRVLVSDALITHELLSWDVFDRTQRFEPFGEGNPKPTFIAQGLPVLDCRAVGRAGDHAKFTFQVGDEGLDGIGFGLASEISTIGQRADVLFELDVNEFRGQTKLQLRLKDYAPEGRVAIEEEKIAAKP